MKKKYSRKSQYSSNTASIANGSSVVAINFSMAHREEKGGGVGLWWRVSDVRLEHKGSTSNNSSLNIQVLFHLNL
jgi:hypothetical protein